MRWREERRRWWRRGDILVISWWRGRGGECYGSLLRLLFLVVLDVKLVARGAFGVAPLASGQHPPTNFGFEMVIGLYEST